MTAQLLLLISFSLVAYVVYALIALVAAWSWSRAKHPIAPEWTPAVTVLKPLRGLDAEAYHNFVSFCHQDYPPNAFR